ncbi:MAG: MerR family transcriptional regulator [Polaromonas sp.]|uniref:MerR family transcriptional regulator n=1 Tax=Polaromonas sp. TaxID=1869339 RepID=UPI003264C783
MNFPHAHPGASEAARRLGVSIKALRLYEQRGLVTPERTAAGYRVYGPDAMARAAEVVALRKLGLSLAQIAEAFEGDPQSLEPALALHEASLESEVRKLVDTIGKVRTLRADLLRGKAPGRGELERVLNPYAKFNLSFELPWPWGGEWFELADIRPLNYIIGPLGSGKTRLALLLAEGLPNAVFLGLDRADRAAANTGILQTDATVKQRVEGALAWLVDEGAVESEALTALLAGLEAEGPAVFVVDMVEQGLDQTTQEALIIYLRQRARVDARPLFLLTRSSAILDLAAMGAEETIILCPANHSPPMRVAPYPGAAGYEAVMTCLASPEVRARTAGMIATIPETA